MNKQGKFETIFLSTLSQVSLFSHELTGQISDGMFEGSSPKENFRFWCALDAKVDPVGTPRVESERPWACKKRSYGFKRLYAIEDVCERMINIGRMGRAAQALGMSEPIACDAARFMPPTLEEWTRNNETRAWQYDFVTSYMAELTPELVTRYYATVYGMDDLRADIKVIQSAMKDIRQVDSRLE